MAWMMLNSGFLAVQEAEHLEWGTRLRIAMGIAYCLEHMHQLTPPIAHKNLQSCSAQGKSESLRVCAVHF